MSSSFSFEAEERTTTGSTAARALRRENKVPAILYGGSNDPVLLSMEHNQVLNQLKNDAVYSHVLSIRFSGKEESAILKNLQRHPSKPLILHMDLQRVSKTEKIRVNVPLHFVNEDTSIGVKKGGVAMHNLVDMEIACLPGDLPEFIEVDLALLDIGDNLHLSDLVVPKGVEITGLSHGTESDALVATIQTARVEEAVDEEQAEAEGELDEETPEDAESKE